LEVHAPEAELEPTVLDAFPAPTRSVALEVTLALGRKRGGEEVFVVVVIVVLVVAIRAGDVGLLLAGLPVECASLTVTYNATMRQSASFDTDNHYDYLGSERVHDERSSWCVNQVMVGGRPGRHQAVVVVGGKRERLKVTQTHIQ